MNISTQRKNARKFIEEWKDRGREKQDSQSFWLSLLHNILGVENPEKMIRFEEKVKLTHDSFIDAYIDQTHTMIEQKGANKDLDKAIKQSDGSLLTPYQQAFRYSIALPYSKRPRWIITCNFKEFRIYDMEHPNSEPTKIELKDLAKDFYQLDFLVKRDITHIQKEEQISVNAGELVNKMYVELLNIFSNYPNFDSEKVKHSINELCVRLVFCLYAEDAGLFNKEAFYNYLKDVEPNKIGLKLKELFKVLNTKEKVRDKDDAFWTAEHPVLSAFPYVNGGLFADQDVKIPPFTAKLKDILLNQASRGFNWKDINPTIFGAVFESTLNPETRRQGGMHYTSIENIHKVIDPLFLNGLKEKLQRIKNKYKGTKKLTPKQKKDLKEDVQAYQEKLAKLKFFDPACGSGNFLTETFLSLRRLENEAIRFETGGESVLDAGQADDWIKVSIQQFYGIEINDFAVAVAKTALWIAENQMMKETQDLIYAPNWNFLPLKTYVKIHEGDALHMDWHKVAGYDCDYIFGNPPFVGARLMAQNSPQKKELQTIFSELKKNEVQVLDYVTCWYKRACEYIKGTKIEVAFVSTNSICQGSQVPVLWNVLFNEYKIHINFAYQSFIWSNKADSQAHVWCVIVGFSQVNKQPKKLFRNSSFKLVDNISPYLTEGSDVFVTSHNKPLCKVPKMIFGNQPRDGGHFVIDEDEYNDIVKKEPKLKQWLSKYIGAEEFLHNKKRWCLWLKHAKPSDIKNSPILYAKVKAVKEFRMNSKAKTTNGYAKVPQLFAQLTQPEGVDYLVVPCHTSSARTYIPIDFMSANVISSNAVQIIPNAGLYELGILESVAHMAWMRIVAGRLGKGYRYSAKIVYNNFPWCTPNPKQRAKIEETAQAILDARANHPNDSLADLYDPLTMPSDLRKAHQANDKAVLRAYGLSTKATESEIVAHLFKMYEQLTKDEK